MTDRKFCKRCGVLISDLNNNADWFSHIRIQYCDICRKDSEREKTALRIYNFRQRKKLKNKLRDEKLALLEEENELLRQRVIQLREEVSKKS